MATNQTITLSTCDATAQSDDGAYYQLSIPSEKFGSTLENSTVTLYYTTFMNLHDIVNQYNKFFFFSEDGGATVTATLVEGFYDANTLATQLQTQLNAVSAFGAIYTVTFSSVTNKYTIAVGGGHTMAIIPGTFNIYYETGMTADSIARTSQVSPGKVDVSGPKVLHVLITPIYTRNVVSLPTIQSLFTVPLTAGFGKQELFVPNVPVYELITSTNLKEMQITLYDEFGKRFSMPSNVDFHICLNVTPASSDRGNKRARIQ